MLRVSQTPTSNLHPHYAEFLFTKVIWLWVTSAFRSCLTTYCSPWGGFGLAMKSVDQQNVANGKLLLANGMAVAREIEWGHQLIGWSVV